MIKETEITKNKQYWVLVLFILSIENPRMLLRTWDSEDRFAAVDEDFHCCAHPVSFESSREHLPEPK